MSPEGAGNPLTAKRQEAPVIPFDKTKEGRPIASAIRRHINQEFKSQFRRREQLNTDEVDAFLESMPQRLRGDAIAKIAAHEDAWTGEQKLAQAKDRFDAAEKALDRMRSIKQQKNEIEKARAIRDPKERSKALKLHRSEISRLKGEREIALGALEPIREKVLKVARAYRAAVRQLPKVADSAREVAEAEIVRKSKHPITNRRDLTKPAYRAPGVTQVPQPRLRPGFEVEAEEPGEYRPLPQEVKSRESSVGVPPIPPYKLDPRRGAELLAKVPQLAPLPKEVIERILHLHASRENAPDALVTKQGAPELTQEEDLALIQELFSTIVQAITSDDSPEEVRGYLTLALKNYDTKEGSVEGFVSAIIFAGLQDSRFKAPKKSFFEDAPYLQVEKALVDMVNEGLTTLDAVGIAKAFPGYLEGMERGERDNVLRSMLRTCRTRIVDVMGVL